MKIRAKKKSKFKVEKLVEDKKGKNKLKVGDLLLYKTRTHLEKCEVINLDGKIATLNNKVTVHRRYSNNIVRCDGKPDCIILPWSDEINEEYEVYAKMPELIKVLKLATEKCNSGNISLKQLNKALKVLKSLTDER